MSMNCITLLNGIPNYKVCILPLVSIVIEHILVLQVHPTFSNVVHSVGSVCPDCGMFTKCCNVRSSRLLYVSNEVLKDLISVPV